MPKSKPKINAYDAFALLNRDKLYPNQLYDVLVDGLQAKKILCISDTTDVLIPRDKRTKSIAHTIEKSGLGQQISVIQSDYIPFSYADRKLDLDDELTPRFGAHLPQNHHEIRREYHEVNATRLSVDLEPMKDIDVILGRSCLCACGAMEDHLCGGIAISEEAQKKYIESLMKLKPTFLVLSASQATFYPENDTAILMAESKRNQEGYRQAQRNLIHACDQLNAEAEHSGSVYRYVFVPPHENFRRIYTGEFMENGYMLVAYDTTQVDFQNTPIILEAERLSHKSSATTVVKIGTDDVPVRVDPEAILDAQNAKEFNVFNERIIEFNEVRQNDALREKEEQPTTSRVKIGIKS